MVVPSSSTHENFIKTTLTIDKTRFYRLHQEWDIANGLTIQNIDLTYSNFKKRLDRVGTPWGWDQRPKYQDRLATLERILDPRSKMYGLYLQNTEIGYSLTVPRDDLSKVFQAQVTEIENFGLALEFNGKGYGAPFFKHVCDEIFSSGSDLVYLSTRSTNHEKVLPFYQKLGMTILKQEEMTNDIA